MFATPFKFLIILLACVLSVHSYAQQSIDRKALVDRHNVIITKADSLSSLSVGNGRFAFTVDITGLQSFPQSYQNGVPLGTESEWGWHSFMNTNGYKREEALKNFHLNGRDISYLVENKIPARSKAASDWFRQNPHRLQLGNLGFEILKKDGTVAAIGDIENCNQQLNLWTGEIKSRFTVEGIPVTVSTFCNQQQDVISANVQSDLIKMGRLKVILLFPYPTGEWSDVGTNYAHTDKHLSSIQSSTSQGASLIHQLDTTQYHVDFSYTHATISKRSLHHFVITPAAANSFEFSCRFAQRPSSSVIPTYTATKADNQSSWQQFWTKGAAVDFSGSTDQRAFELERRIILSQYLIKIQETGSNPPQETGLTYNSWYGKPHMEMPYWHLGHYPFWGHKELLEKTMDWYFRAEVKGRGIDRKSVV